MENAYRIRLFRLLEKLRKYVTLLGSMSHILKRIRRAKKMNEQTVKKLNKHLKE